MCKAALASEWFIEDTQGLNTSVDLGLNLDFKVMNLIAMHLPYQLVLVSFMIQQNDSRERFAHVSYAGSPPAGRVRYCIFKTGADCGEWYAFLFLNQSTESSFRFWSYAIPYNRFFPSLYDSPLW